MAENVQNQVTTSINMSAGLDHAATSMTVANGGVFTAAPNFRVVVDSEIMLVTGVAGNVLTVVRGQEGTTATAHANGTAVVADLTAGALTTYISENVTPVAHGCRVTHNTGQALGASGDQAVAFNTEVFDTDAYHDNATNNSRITVPAGLAGYYVVASSVEWAASSGLRVLGIRVNGTSTVVSTDETAASGSVVQRQNVAAIVHLAVGDYVEAIVYSGVGGGLTVNNSADYSPVLSVLRVSA